MKRGLVLGILLASILLISGLNGCENIDTLQLSSNDLTLDSVKWSCSKEECGEIDNCGGSFTYLLENSGIDGKLCKAFVNGKSFPYPHDQYLLESSGTAGIPLEHDVYNQQEVKVCCSNNIKEFSTENYAVCQKILLKPLCDTPKEDSETEKQERIIENKYVIGDDLCENGETYLNSIDCQVPCESDYCNSKITVYCKEDYNCNSNFIPTVFDYQNEVYDCLHDYLNYSPQRRMRYYVVQAQICESDSFCDSIGTADYIGVNLFGFGGIHQPGKSSVNSEEDLRADIHETTHVFTNHAFGNIPKWFDEGISIYTTDKLSCHIKQQEDGRLIYAVKRGYSYINTGKVLITESTTPHEIGASFFAGLEADYNCDKSCIKQILNSLKPHKGAIDNQIIKKVSEEVIEKDLSPLFDLLKVGY